MGWNFISAEYSAYPDQLFAGVGSLEEADEGARHFFEALDDVLFVFKFVAAYPATQFLESFAVAFGEVEDQESLDGSPLDDQVPQETRSGFTFREIVLRYLPADSNATVEGKVGEDGIGHCSAYVVEVAVDSVGAVFAQCFDETLGRFVINGGIKAQVLCQPTTFFVGTRKAYGTAAFDFGDLSDGGSDGSRCSGNHDGLSLLGLNNIKESEVGRQSGHAQNMEGSGNRGAVGIEFADFGGGYGPELLPADVGKGSVSGLEAITGAGDDFSDCLTGHDVAQLHRVGVGFSIGHATSHVGIDSEEFALNDDFSVFGFRDRFLGQLEVFHGHHAAGAGGETPLSIVASHNAIQSC